MTGNSANIIYKHTILPGERLFLPLNDYLILLAAIAHASSFMVDGKTHKIERPLMRLNALKIDLAFAIPLRGPLENALADKHPSEIQIGVVEKSNPDMPLVDAKHQTAGLSSVMYRLIEPIFLAFFERYNVWLKANHGEGIKWPPTLNFARVVKNSVSHGGIDIRNPATPPVSWRGITYGYADNGTKIIGPDHLGPGDILKLMFDANEELDKMGAPIL